MSQDEERTEVLETYDPIKVIDCATMIDPKNHAKRRIALFQFENEPITAFYQSTGSSSSSRISNLLAGTYFPFYGETKKLLKAMDVYRQTINQSWKKKINEMIDICKFSKSVLNYFNNYFELQISASIDSQYWQQPQLKKCRSFILHNNYDPIVDDFSPTPSYCERTLQQALRDIDDTVEYCQLGYSLLPHEIFSYFTAKRKGSLLQYNGNCTHSYVLTRKGMKRILENYEPYKETTHLDYFYKDLFKEYGWCSCPMLFDQNFCLGTDNAVEEEGDYFQWLRKFSCLAHRGSIMYLLTLLRYFIVELLLFFIYVIIIKTL